MTEKEGHKGKKLKKIDLNLIGSNLEINIINDS